MTAVEMPRKYVPPPLELVKSRIEELLPPAAREEIEGGIKIEDFRMDNMLKRVETVGDLFKPVLQAKTRIKLDRYL